MTARPTLLKVLLRQRHWQTYSAFCDQYDAAARVVDPKLVGMWPSRAQVHRWLSGELRGLPYAHHCRVLEQMFPGHGAAALFGPCPDEVPTTTVQVSAASVPSGPEPVSQFDGLADRATAYMLAPALSVDLLSGLVAGDLADDAAVQQAAWSSEATMGAITGYLFGQPNLVAASVGEMLSGVPEAAAIRATAAHLTDLDFRFGGGYTRRLLLFYFQSEVVPLLRASHLGPVRREIFSAAAEVAQLIGWSAYDAGRHGAAQRFYVQALRLAREANDHMLGAKVLSNMSHQANYLGHFNDAAQLARAAQSEAFGKSSVTVLCNLYAMEARALASSGYERECAEVLRRAEDLFEQRDPQSDPPWIEYFDAEELAGEAAHCFRDLGKSAATREFAERAIDPTNTPPRTQAFIGMVAAAGELTAGDLDAAAARAIEAVDLAGPLRSDRYLRYLTDFHRDLTAKKPRHPLLPVFVERVQSNYPTLTLNLNPGG